jgi:NADPH:quinone reductase-like Zn-dependent oxidoreductase
VSDLIQDFNHGLNANLRVKVHSVALNMVDALYTQYPLGEQGRVVGSDISGVVDKIGAGVTEWRVGDRVAGLLQGGTLNQIGGFS